MEHRTQTGAGHKETAERRRLFPYVGSTRASDASKGGSAFSFGSFSLSWHIFSPFLTMASLCQLKAAPFIAQVAAVTSIKDLSVTSIKDLSL